MADNRFIVSDEDGELRRFATKVDALAFIGNHTGMTLKTLPKVRAPERKPIDPIDLVGECLI